MSAYRLSGRAVLGRAVLGRAVVALLVPTIAAIAQGRAADSGSVQPRPTAAAAWRSGEIRLDGRLDEAAWAAAVPITSFTQQVPHEGAPAGMRTEVRVLYDAAAMYVGARMYDPAGAAGVTSRLALRDADPQSDELILNVDAFHDRLHNAEFDVDPAGWRGDSYDGDASWDPVWDAATSVDSLGWTAEIRIPFSQLHFSRDSAQTWGFDVSRLVHRTQERDLWAFWRQNDAGGPAFYGDLAGIRVRAAPPRLELVPYVVGQEQSNGSGNRQSPFYRPHRSQMREGADIRYRLASSFTLSATVNPDFGQVEVDPAVVNLTAFETFFPEKRPFFVEGSNLYSFGYAGCDINCGLGLDLFYSRRVGRPPEGAVLAYSAGPFADVPANTKIIGAVKLAGRTQSGLSIGALDAVTAGEAAVVELPGGSRSRVAVEPLTNDLVTRATRELDGGNLRIGGMFTSVNRDLRDPGVSAFLPRAAQSGGVDVQRYWDQHAWRFYAAVSASRVSGDSAAILRLERSPAHYFQRPDRRAASGGSFGSAYDSTATALAGYGMLARLARQGGNWIGDVNAALVSPGYEINDLGFLPRADYRWLNGTIARKMSRPTSWYRTFAVATGAERYWNGEGDATQTDLTALTLLQTLDYWNGELLVERTLPGLNDRATRGGPIVGYAGNTSITANLSTDPRRGVQLAEMATVVRFDDGGRAGSASVTATVHPAPDFNVTVGPGFSRSVTTDQYVTAVADSTDLSFGGRRYVFSHLDQRQLFMTARGNVTVRPSLSLDLFAQPLLASGAYTDFEEFVAPRAIRKVVYGRDRGTITPSADGASYRVSPDPARQAPSFTVANPDFNLRSLRGTAVVRWEWRPGSTAYLVWTQTRSGDAPLGDLKPTRDVRGLLATPADNTFVVKISYRIGG